MRDEFQQMKEDGEMNRLIREIKVRNQRITHHNHPNSKMVGSVQNQMITVEPPMTPTIRDDLHNDDWDDPSGVNRLFEELNDILN